MIRRPDAHASGAPLTPRHRVTFFFRTNELTKAVDASKNWRELARSLVVHIRPRGSTPRASQCVRATYQRLFLTLARSLTSWTRAVISMIRRRRETRDAETCSQPRRWFLFNLSSTVDDIDDGRKSLVLTYVLGRRARAGMLARRRRNRPFEEEYHNI